MLRRGPPPTRENLTRAGFTYLGTSGPGDVDVVRQMAHVCEKGLVRILTLVGDRQTDAAHHLAEVVSLRQRKVLVVDTCFDDVVAKQDVPGLWHYLQKEVVQCPIRPARGGRYDVLPAGAVSAHGVELLSRGLFASVLIKTYDLIILSTKASAASMEAKTLLQFSDAAILSAPEESVDELAFYQAWSEERSKGCLGFFLL